MQVSQLQSLADSFSDAAFDDAKWPVALERLASATGSARAQLIGIGGKAAVPFNIVTSCPDGALDEFVAIGGGRPDVSWRVRAAMNAVQMETVSERHYDAARDGIESDVYEEYCDRYDLQFGCQTTLISSADALIGLAILRTAEDGRSTASARQAFRASAPFVRLAVRTANILEQEGARLVAGTLEAMSLAAFVCDDFGLVRALTPEAERSLNNGLPVRLVSSRLKGLRQVDDDVISKALRDAVGNSPGTGRSSTIAIGLAHIPAVLSFVTMPKREWSFGFAPRALVIARRNHESKGPDSALLRSLYGLTASEADVTRAFLAGASRKKIARSRGVSLATVQSQLKIIFRKLEVTREAELTNKLAWLFGTA